LAELSASDGGKRARSPESTKETVKTIAQGMPVDGDVPVVTMLVCFFYFAREASVTGIPCALFSRGFIQASPRATSLPPEGAGVIEISAISRLIMPGTRPGMTMGVLVAV
jgi:hypothetical protein